MERRINTRKIGISGRCKTDQVQESLNQLFRDEIDALKRNDEEMKDQIARNHEEVMNLLKPISETYTTATTLGKWLTAGAVFVSIVIGIVVGVQRLLHK